MAAAVGSLFVNKASRGEYMNWTIDFKGGTEIIFAFKDPKTGTFVEGRPGQGPRGARGGRRARHRALGHLVHRVRPTRARTTVNGMIIRTPAVLGAQAGAAGRRRRRTSSTSSRTATSARRRGPAIACSCARKKPITHEEAAAVFAKPRPRAQAVERQGERPVRARRRRHGRVQRRVLDLGPRSPVRAAARERARATSRRSRCNSYGVGAKAGEKLRDDAAKSIIYAIFLIMLYLAFRFDIRYAPGAAFATIHDAVMVIGVFALTWTEVSLTSVAGLLTVIGYSVNDTVIVFDRIRENQAKLKDKKLERIIDISLNEMLVRTILTSSTVFATTLIMNIFGTGLVKNFAFAMNIGVIVGTYSSIFLATPIFMWVSKKWYSGPPKARRAPAPVPTTSEG